jgi:hypothetical protein
MDAPLAFYDLLIRFDDEFGRSGFRKILQSLLRAS